MKNARAKKGMLVVGLVMLINALSYGTIIPLLYPYSSKFGIDAVGLSFLFASYSLAQFIATPVIGRLSDVYGRKPLLLLSLFGTSISLGFFASAQLAWHLFVARILDGITGGNISVAQAVIADSYRPKDRAKGFAMLGATFGFGFALGPAIGSFLSSISLTAPFWFGSIFALVGTLIGIIFLEETNTHLEKKLSSKTISLSTTAKALKKPVTGIILLVSFLALTGNNAMIIGFQSFTVDVLQLSTQKIGLLFTLFGIMNILVQGFGMKYILSLSSSKRFLVKSFLALSAAMVFVASFTTTFITFTIAVLLFGAFFAPISAIVTSLLSERTRTEDQGGMLGINQSLSSVAQIVGPLSAGAVVMWGTEWTFRLTAIFITMALISAKFISEKNKALVDL